MAGLGPLSDTVMLWDLLTRVTGFINDLRHAQDDFMGLRSEAECLRICINALISKDCEKTMSYISVEQRNDLRSITNGCKSNMEELNAFIAKCTALVEKSNPELKGKKNKPGFRKWWRQKFAQAWASFKFVMTDKQPFRDKLLLPTQSINIFLTSLTHVGIARVLMVRPSASALPTTLPSQPLPGGDFVDSWDAVGYKIAFRDVEIDRGDLILPGIEDEIIAFSIQLIKDRTGKPGRGRVVKPVKPDRKISRSQKGIGRKQMYVMRRRSVVRPEGIQVVRTEGDSDSGPEPGRLLIEAPPAPGDSGSVRYAERRPAFSDNDSDGGSRERTWHRPTRPQGSDRIDAELEALRRGLAEREQAVREREEQLNRKEERPERASAETSARRRAEEQSCRRQVKEQIRREQQDAVRNMEHVERVRRESRMSRPLSDNYVGTPVRPDPEEDPVEEAMDYLMDQYGLQVICVGDSREPIDSGAVCDDPVEELSDPEDVKPVFPREPPSRSYVDRLRAETSFSPRPSYDPEYESRYTRPADRRYSRPERYASYMDEGRQRRSRPTRMWDEDGYHDSVLRSGDHRAPRHSGSRPTYGEGRPPDVFISSHDGPERSRPPRASYTSETESESYRGENGHEIRRTDATMNRDDLRPARDDEFARGAELHRRASYGGPETFRRPSILRRHDESDRERRERDELNQVMGHDDGYRSRRRRRRTDGTEDDDDDDDDDNMLQIVHEPR